VDRGGAGEHPVQVEQASGDPIWQPEHIAKSSQAGSKTPEEPFTPPYEQIRVRRIPMRILTRPAGSAARRCGAALAQPVNTPQGGTAMRFVWIVLGIVAVALGVLWTLQGLDLLGQEGGMNGNSTWAIIGPIVAVVGLLLLLFGARKRRNTV
jgi:hypothetical protein